MPAASSKNVRAGGAYVEFFAKDGALDASLRRIGSKLKNFGAAASMTGAMISGVGAVAAAPFAMGIRTFADFEQGMANVRALTRATDDQFKTLTDTARKLGKETKYTAREASDAMYVFAMAGMEAEKIALAVGPALSLAAAGDIGIAEAADITMKVMAGMGIEAENLGHTIDVLAKAQATANTNMSQLGQAMKYVAPTAKQAGYGLEETVAAVQLLSNAGQQADMAGTSISGGIMSLTQPSEEAARTLRHLGVKISDANGQMRPLADIIDDLNAGMDGLGSARRLAIIGRIFDARQARGFAELMSQGGQALRDATTALQNSEGEAARIAEVKMNTIEGRLAIAKSAIDDMFITLGTIFVEPVKKAIEALTVLVNKTAEWIDAHHTAVRIASATASALLAVGMAFTAIGVSSMAAGMMFNGFNTTIRFTVTALTGLYRVSRVLSLFNALSAGAGLLSAGMISLTGATSLATAAYSVLSGVVAFTLSPLGLVVAAVAAAVYWWDDLYSIAMTFADQVGAGMEVFGGIIWGVFSSLGEVISATWRTITIFITSSEYLMEVWGRAVGLYNLVVSVVSEVGSTLLFVARGLWSATSAVVSYVTGAISSVMGVLQSVAAAVIPYGQEIVESLMWAAGEVYSFVAKLYSKFFSVLTYPIRTLYGVVSPPLIAIGKRLIEFGGSVVQTIRQWMSAIPGLVSSAWGFISQYVVSIGSAAGSIASDLGAWLGSVFSQISTLFGDLWSIASETFTAIQTAISNGNWEAAGNALWAALKLAWVQGTNTINSIWRAASGEVIETWQGTVDILSSIWAGLIADIEGKLAAAQNKTASWIIEAQRMAGVLSDEEAKGAQEELALMGKEAQQRIASRKTDAQREIEAEAEKRREAARQADADALSASETRLKEAREEYEAAMKAATEAKPAAESSPAGQAVANNVKKLGETLAPTIAKTGSAGGAGGGLTLSAFASRMFSGGEDPAKKTAKNTEKMTKQLQQVIDENLLAPDPQLMVA